MPYLDEAARQLGISEKTLRRWLKLMDPPIEPTKDRRNLRFKFIEESDVERIRQERASVAALTGVTISIASKPAFRRSPSRSPDLPIATDSFSPLAPTPRPRQPQRRAQFAGGLPDGWMSRTKAAEEHGLSATTVRRWIEAHGFETNAAPFGGENGQFTGERPLTQRGLAQLVAYARVHQPQNFHPCDLCSHEEQITERAHEQNEGEGEQQEQRVTE